MIHNHEVASSSLALATLKGGRVIFPPFLFNFMDKYYLYIIHSEKLDRYYTGSCSDPEQRLIRHNAGATPSTKPGRPWTIVYSEEFSSRSEAIKRENYVKRQKSRVFIENLIPKR